MTAVVSLPGVLRAHADGRAEVVVETEGSTTTVRAVLDRLSLDHPGLVRRIRDEQGELRRFVNVYSATPTSATCRVWRLRCPMEQGCSSCPVSPAADRPSAVDHAAVGILVCAWAARVPSPDPRLNVHLVLRTGDDRPLTQWQHRQVPAGEPEKMHVLVAGRGSTRR
jgi:hypothetical protein